MSASISVCGATFEPRFNTRRDNLEQGQIYCTHNPPPDDPLFLLSSKKSKADLKRMKKEGISNKIRKFYIKQNKLIDSMLSPHQFEVLDQDSQQLRLKIAIYGTVGANVVLFCLQLIAATTSGSLSIFSTMSDSFMDLLSSAVLLWTSRQAAKVNLLEYPNGKARVETAGIIVFSSLMSCLALFLIIEAVQKLANPGTPSDLGPLAIGCIATALAIKLVLYCYCISLSRYSSARVLAQDHFNDLLINTLGLTTGIVGSKLAAWVDPVGSIVIALIILRSWLSTLLEHTRLIVGKSADPEFLQIVTYIALTHPSVELLDTCRAYYTGNSLFVEVDIILSPDTPLRKSHDIGESLQEKLERLKDVERAFVHVDYSKKSIETAKY
ncbi:cation efflux family-domain-containing protein [Phycomyces blakesleeanus]